MRQRVGQWANAAGDIVRRHRPDYLILLYMALLMLFGLIIIYAIGPQRANVLNNSSGSDYSDIYFVVKQAISLVLALIAFAIFAIAPYRWALKHGGLFLVFGLVACALLFIAQLGHLSIAQCSLGACRWFDLGPLGTLQPAEVLKFGMLLYIASFLGVRAKEGKVNDPKATLIPIAILAAISMLFIIVIQKDLGTGIALTAIIVSMLFIAGISRKLLFGMMGVLLLAGIIFIFSAPHRVERIFTYVQGDNTSTTDDNSYHIEHAKIAIGSGGLFGRGIGNSVESTGYLPEAINDSVFAVMGETFGFVLIIHG